MIDAVRGLLTKYDNFRFLAALILCSEAVLGALIILRVPCACLRARADGP